MVKRNNFSKDVTPKIVNRNCDSCGGHRWDNLSGGGAMLPVMMLHKEGEAAIDKMGFYEVHAVACKGCGLLRFYLAFD